ncbi:MAG: hypothetical protein O3B13_07675 [Planctomycetota bacterium]|nr:hypothetical protein [Planctomycetota bacterium]
MSTISLLEPGARVLVVHRRLFERDDNRLFVGEVEAMNDGVFRTTGYTFVRDTLGGTIRRKSDPRTKLLSLTSGTLIVYVLPAELDLSRVEIQCEETEVWLTDGNDFSMNLSEWTHRSH